MIGEYEIPKGSKLYFAKSAKRKREIENRAVDILVKSGFEEIVTPLFSYHQEEKKGVVKFGDESNNLVAIRADSSLEVVRLIQKRLGKTTSQRDWFYIQPIFAYPTTELYQIGAESIGSNDLAKMIDVCASILSSLDIKPLLQIGSIALLDEIQRILSLPDQTVKRHDLHKIFASKEAWAKELLELNSIEDLQKIKTKVPKEIEKHLISIEKLATSLGYQNIAISPFYYADMPYYDDLYFRFLLDGKQIAMGGSYESENERAAGFAIYTDLIV